MNEHPTISHYAVLIGIDDYPSAPLISSVADVQEVQRFLEISLGEDVKIYSLVAKRNDHAAEDLECRPTYENVRSVLRNITTHASPGSFVYFHFSGHGTSRQNREFIPGDDVGLVLLNDHDPERFSYLWGEELARQIKWMIEKQLIVTIVLDCAFSGAVQQEELDVYFSSYDSKIDLRTQDIQKSSSQAQNILSYPDDSGLPNLLPGLGSYAILAACGPNECANSLEFNGKRHGILSYFVFDTLKLIGLHRSHKTVHDRVCAKIRGAGIQSQNPVLYGNKDQAFFGLLESTTTTINIPIVKMSEGKILLQAGYAHGVSTGDEFVLSPTRPSTVNDGSHGTQLIAKVTSCSGLSSILEIASQTKSSPRTGWLATPEIQNRRRTIPIQLTPSIPEHHVWHFAMNAKSLEIHSTSHESPAVFQVLLSDDNHYQILDEAGSKLANLPSMPQKQTSIEEICNILEHLVRYRLAEDLINDTTDVGFLDDITISIRSGGASYSWQDQIAVSNGAIAEVIVKNNGSEPVYVFCLDFGSHWQVMQIFYGKHYVIGPKSVVKKKIKMSIPESIQKQSHKFCKDILKIIVTSQPTSFDMLELPPLGGHAKTNRSSNTARGATGGPETWTAVNFPIYTYLRPEGHTKQADRVRSLESGRDNQNWTTEVLEEPDSSFQQSQDVESKLELDRYATVDVTSDAAYPSKSSTAAYDVLSSIPPLTFVDSGYGSNKTDRPIDIDQSKGDDSISLSSNITLPPDQRSAYQSAFVTRIINILESQSMDETNFENFVEVLPDMLKTFALKIGYLSESRPAKNIMRLTMKYHKIITTQLEEQWRDEQQRKKRKAEEVPWNDRVKLLGLHQDLGSAIYENLPHDTAHIQILDDISVGSEACNQEEPLLHSDNKVPETDIDMEFVFRSPAYAWLVAEVEKKVRLTVPNSDIDSLLHLTRSLSDAFLLPQITGRNLVPKEHRVLFSVDWSPVQFLNQYSFDDMLDAEEIFKSFVTLTGDGRDVQALTCEQFLQQTWPTSGQHMLSLLTGLVHDGHAKLELEGATILGWLQDQRVCVEVTGHAQSIKEIGQQLAWIGSAMWLSPDEGHIYHCSPSYSNIGFQGHDTDKPYDHCTISFKSESMQPMSECDGCWYDLFQYPVIAVGFPIMKRPESALGLEIELGIMLTLSHAQHMGKIYSKIAIKGFSSMFTLTHQAVGLSLWHYSGDIDGPFISYAEMPDSPDFTSLDVRKVIQDRHFVGWCKNSTYGVGAVSSNYDIEESGLLNLGPGHRLSGRFHRRPYRPEQVAACIARTKQRTTRTPWDSLVERLQRIDRKPVILWDTSNKRGWLTNGTSALLHLVFASLEYDANGNFNKVYSFRRSDIRSPDRHEWNSAAKILVDEYNLNLKIMSCDSQTICFKNRVEDICYLLEAMIEDQITFISEQPPMNMLEGWDFTDIAQTDHDPLLPQATELLEDCLGWPDFVKDTGTLVLFGQGFGEMYSPIDEHPSCSHWARIPTDQFYLAASVRDLDWIMKKFGSRRTTPKRLSQNTIWVVLSTTFEGCSCNITQEHSNLVQILVPSSEYKPSATTLDTIDQAPAMGAVVFGEIADSQWLKDGYSPIVCNHSLVNISSAGNRDCEKDSGHDSSILSLRLSLRRDDYFIAIVCALPIELRAVRLLFDERHENQVSSPDDPNRYVFGRMHGHNIVAACLPKGRYGNCSAAAVATHLKRSFPKVGLYILVGIGGGIATYDNDIRLGDVVVSVPDKGYPGILEYDFEKLTLNTSYRLGSLPQPPAALLCAISDLQSDPDLLEDSLQPDLAYISSRDPKYTHPSEEEDRLHASDYEHVDSEGYCSLCIGPTVSRKNRGTPHPRIHYGLVASGDKLVTDARLRDTIQKQYQALCFEMEAAGIANTTACLVIRGICDYSDSHKHEAWQRYACATAAAYTKLLLSKVTGACKPV